MALVRAERLAELKRTNVPRCSIERLGVTVDPPSPFNVDDLEFTERARGILNAYLRRFTDPADPKGCPNCGGALGAGWGYAYGSIMCGCGWPGTRLHFVRDPGDEAECEHCEAPKSAHASVSREAVPYGTGLSIARVELVCPRDDGGTYKAPTILAFDRILWAHPYDVHLSKEA